MRALKLGTEAVTEGVLRNFAWETPVLEFFLDKVAGDC